jgi:hypothetical protein
VKTAMENKGHIEWIEKKKTYRVFSPVALHLRVGGIFWEDGFGYRISLPNGDIFQ